MTYTRALVLLLVAGCGGSRLPLPAPQLPLVTAPASARVAPPAVADDDALPALPDIRAFRLDNGLAVYLLERHAYPHVAAAYVSLRGGEDPADLEESGLASVIHELLLAPSGKSSGGAPEAAAASRAAGAAPTPISFGGAVLRHVAYVSTSVESRDLAAALSRMAGYVTRPALTAQSLGRARKRARWSWSDEQHGAMGVTRNHLMQRIYGPAHVLGQHADMAVKRVDAHELDAVAAGYAARYVPAASAILLVGDVTEGEARALVDGAFGSWRSEAAAPKSYAPSDWMPRGKRKVFLPSGLRQSYVVVGQRAPGAGSPDYMATEVLTALLGGSYGSRLMTRLRTRDNLTYHIGATLAPRRDGSTLLIETAVARDDTRQSLEAIIEEMSRLQSERVSADELTRTKHGLVMQALAGYETTSGALGEMLQALELGRDPSKALAEHLAALSAVDPATLQDVARRVLSPQKAPVIILADLRFEGLGHWAIDDDETF
jgi:zinc protease